MANAYRRDLLALALRVDQEDAERIVLPRVVGPHEAAARGGGDVDGRDLSHLMEKLGATVAWSRTARAP